MLSIRVAEKGEEELEASPLTVYHANVSTMELDRILND